MISVQRRKSLAMFWYWYLILVPKKILKIWRNFLFFGWRFFSIGLLMRTLFTPWKRDVMRRQKGAGLKVFFESLIINIFTRCLGAVLRSVVIILGLIFELIILICGSLVFFGWLAWPLVSIAAITGAIMLFSRGPA